MFSRLWVVTLLLAAAATAAEPFFTLPYLQLGNHPNPKDGALTLLWHTADEEAGWKVQVQTEPDRAWRSMAAPTFRTVRAPGTADHRVYRTDLTRLPAGRPFQYRVQRNDTTVFTAQAQGRKTAAQPQHFVVVGDIAAGTPGQRAIAYQIGREKPDFVAIPGDIVYSSGRVSEYRSRFFPVYNAETAGAETGAPLLRSIPFIAVPGNHDTALNNFNRFPDAQAYFLYWDQPLNGPALAAGAPNTAVLKGNPEAQPAFLAAAGANYPRMANFSYDTGNAHWTLIDSNPYVDWTNPALQKWLKDDLAAAKSAQWRFVVLHHPGFQSAKAHFDDQWIRLLAPLFEEAKVDIVFAGHVHDYQRSYPLTFRPDAAPAGAAWPPKTVSGQWTLDKDFADGATAKPKGVLYIVTGAGGAGLYVDVQGGAPQPFTDKFYARTHSFTVIDIQGKTLKARQVNTAGETVDTWQIRK